MGQTATAKPLIARSSNILITNMVLTLSGTEYSHALQSGLKQLYLASRDNTAILKYAFVSGDSGIKYMTLNGCCSLNLTDIELQSMVLYIQSSKATTTIEIMELY